MFVISDVTFDHIAKEIDVISSGNISCMFSYQEDIVSKMLSVESDDFKGIDVLFIHSDQVFHNRPSEWQKVFCNTLLHFSSQLSNITILVSNSLTGAFKTPPFKGSFGNSFDVAYLFSAEISSLLERSNIFVFDFLSILKKLGENNCYNYPVGHLYQMPYTKKAIGAIAEAVVNQSEWLFGEEKKVIVLDCDNTLWKGIVGEDGINGIYCNKDAEGIIHYHFHEFLKGKKEEGFLLCICSKNNEKDVQEAFEKKKFVLKWDDFIIRKINWNDKVANMKEIAAELNVGTDSFIFVDDNKYELDFVSNSLKGITCIEFTEDYTNFIALINRFEFKKKLVLKDDIAKTEQYIKQQQRAGEEQNYENIDEFIKSLEIKMDIRLNDTADLERLSQMTGKTNQFNFNKQPYTSEQLNNFIVDRGRLYSLSVSDKFGDYGTVGLIMIKPAGNKKEVVLENFLMSCRALGKKIEDSFLNFVLQDIKENSLQLASVKFIRTEKNIPAENFYNKIKNETNHFRTATSVL